MSSTSFPLMELPLLPLSILLKSMPLESLIPLSETNQRFKQFIQLLHIKSGGYHVDIDECRFKISMLKQNFRCSFQEENKSFLLRNLSETLHKMRELFPGPIDQLSICPSFSNYFYDINMECTVLSVGLDPHFMIEYRNTFTEEYLNALLNSVNFKKGLSLRGPILLRTQHEKIFDIDWLKIKCSEWITTAILQKMKNTVIYLADVSFSDKEINEFLHDLKNGNGNNQLQVLTFEKEGGLNEMEIIRGLNAIEMKEERVYKISEFDPSIQNDRFLPFNSGGEISIFNSFDFIRNDGIRCTIEFDYEVIQLFVWNQEKDKKTTRNEAFSIPPAKRIL
ncbi:hypothetical protein CRE_29597 [Caenorhabditis remanei]|uniref:F-box domain-containing protein n=1 Tax=Caenorhabditis remanei TaxID=31234 RepID=E3LVW6_CAERE|nr:hypothetical protein CRE_29597 [Caenorhabditis remanei]